MNKFTRACIMQAPLAELVATRGEPEVAQVYRALTERVAEDGTLGAAALQTCSRSFLFLFTADSGAAAVPATKFILDEADRRAGRTDREVCEAAWPKFAEWRAKAVRVQTALGCDLSQSVAIVADIETRRLSPRTEKSLLEMIELVGKLAAMADVCTTTRTDDPHEMESVEVGDDLERLTADEIGQIATDETADAATLRLLERQSQLVQLTGTAPTGRGPVVLLLDESGSMADALAGGVSNGAATGRNAWSKAVAAALTLVAWRQGREVRVVHYARMTHVRELPADDYLALIDMALHFMNGGTNIAGALRAALQVVRDMESEGTPGADIVIVGDGEDPKLSCINESIDQMIANGTALWTVNIGQDMRRGQPLRDRAERYIFVRDSELSDKDKAVAKLAALGDAARVGTEFGVN